MVYTYIKIRTAEPARQTSRGFGKRKGQAKKEGEMEYKEYIDRKVVRETAKAYMVEQEVNNRRDGWHINYKWVAKKLCKPSEVEGCVSVPEWAVSNGVW